jgi:hypothetical protein
MTMVVFACSLCPDGAPREPWRDGRGHVQMQPRYNSTLFLLSICFVLTKRESRHAHGKTGQQADRLTAYRKWRIRMLFSPRLSQWSVEDKG